MNTFDPLEPCELPIIDAPQKMTLKVAKNTLFLGKIKKNKKKDIENKEIMKKKKAEIFFPQYGS